VKTLFAAYRVTDLDRPLGLYTALGYVRSVGRAHRGRCPPGRFPVRRLVVRREGDDMKHARVPEARLR
jgi:hypothetical protein